VQVLLQVPDADAVHAAVALEVEVPSGKIHGHAGALEVVPPACGRNLALRTVAGRSPDQAISAVIGGIRLFHSASRRRSKTM
jgi:hypothetical protein